MKNRTDDSQKKFAFEKDGLYVLPPPEYIQKPLFPKEIERIFSFREIEVKSGAKKRVAGTG